MLAFRVLGPIEAEADGQLCRLGGPRPRALLARLLLAGGSFVSVDRLIDDLWGEQATPGAAHSLQEHISKLRRAFGTDGAGALEHGGGGYRLVLAADQPDSARFERLLGEAGRAHDDGAHLRVRNLTVDALALWRGEPYADVADALWAGGEIARLRGLGLNAHERNIGAQIELGDHGSAIASLEPLLIAHPLEERWNVLMAHALYRSGSQADALQRYPDFRRALVEESGIEPSARFHDLHLAMLRRDPALDVRVPPTPRVRPLPTPSTSLVGRGPELAALTDLLARDDVRIVTITGPGGTGKTRLALAAAELAAPGFESGACFVSLVDADEPPLVPPAIATALGLDEAGTRTPAQLVAAALADRQMLLVLDNFEHVLPAARHIADLLADAPRLRVLITSRASVRLRGEHEFPVPPLELPRPGASLDEIADSPAVELFARRARQVNPTVRLDDAATQSMAEICRRLDGLPLALELVAARARLLSPEKMLERLGTGLDAGGSASDAPVHQRTLRDTIDWSYELLQEDERTVFRKIGVFAGGFSVEAAEQIIEPPGARSVLDLLDALLANSLLRVTSEGDGRLAMLAVIGEFAREALAHAREAEATRRAHAHYYAQLAESFEPGIARDPAGDEALALERERGNLRAALRFALENDDRALGQRLAGSLELFSEGRDDSIVLLVAEVQRMGSGDE